jgi:hypothetical protein
MSHQRSNPALNLAPFGRWTALKRRRLALREAVPYPECVPGMAQNWRGESPRARYKWSRRLGEGQGHHREVGSGGSPIQKCGATNRNQIGGVVHPGRVGT